MLQKEKHDNVWRGNVLKCVLCVLIAVIVTRFISCHIIKNSEPPEYIIIYEEDVQFTGVVPPIEAAFPYTETYSLNAESFYKISEREFAKWYLHTDGIDYDYVEWEKKYCFTIKTSDDNPSNWTIENVENLSICVKDWVEVFKKEREDPDYKCKTYYTPILPEDYEKIVPMLEQMDIVKNKTVKITVWEFGDEYFHISVQNSDENIRNDAVFRNNKCLAQHLPKRSDIRNITLRIERCIKDHSSY